jgi:thiol-disulfide isomerase/thioredoxin
MSLVTRNVLIALLITILLTGTVTYAVSYLDRARLTELSAIEDQLSIDILSLDTQFSLLEDAPCGSTASFTTLTSELANMGARLAYAEELLGSDNPHVIRLKEQYSLLEIRDYLITKKLASACGTNPTIVLYFYSNAGDCTDCDRAGYALSYLRDAFPALRVYSFDYNLELSALKTFIAVTKVQNNLPSFVINDKHVSGFISLEDLEKHFPKGSLSTSTPAR